jgi:hypothetical protein
MIESRSYPHHGWSEKSDLTSTLRYNFPFYSVQSCKVSCKVFAFRSVQYRGFGTFGMRLSDLGRTASAAQVRSSGAQLAELRPLLDDGTIRGAAACRSGCLAQRPDFNDAVRHRAGHLRDLFDSLG